MAWIESHQELARHPKTKKLAREIGENVRSAIGLLHLLWWWAMDYAQDGDLTKFGPDDIADGVMWDGDPLLLLNSLINSGFVDEKDDETIVIHDWEEYAGRLIEKRKDNAERKKKSRARHTDVTQTSQESHGATNTTQPTQPYQTQQQHSDMSLSLDKYRDEIETTMIAYGTNVKYIVKGDELKLIKDLYVSNVPIDFIKNCIIGCFTKKPDIGSFSYIAKVIKSEWANELIKQKPAEPIDFSAYRESAASREVIHIGRYIPDGIDPVVKEAMEEDERRRNEAKT